MSAVKFLIVDANGLCIGRYTTKRAANMDLALYDGALRGVRIQASEDHPQAGPQRSV